MILAILLLLSGLSISAVAIYYSVVGLTAIFSAATTPIMIMGICLEVGKLVIASWVKAYWNRIPILMRTYAVVGTTVLMIITSLGIFGFLSKAHSDQNLVSGDVTSKIAIYEEKIQTSKENIDANRKALKQMDEAVDQSMVRSTDEKGADKAVAIRRGQAKERARLQAEITAEQTNINKLNEEAAPIRAEVRKVDAEVGPLKYIAAFIYGTNPDSSILEKAVTWVIILIVVVFDPLAVVMLLAAQMTFGWNKEKAEDEVEPEVIAPPVVEEPVAEKIEEPEPVPEVIEPPVPIEEINAMLDEAREPPPETELPEPTILEQHPYLSRPFTHFENLTPVVSPVVNNEPLIKALEGEEAYKLMKSIGIFTEDDKLNPEYGGEEIEEETAPEPEVVEAKAEYINPNAEGMDASVERPGDYITLPVVEEVKPAPVREAAPGRNRKVMNSHLISDNAPELGKASHSDFGNSFPLNADKGDVYLRTDYLPNRLFKFNGSKWIEVDKNQTDVYAYDEMYIKHLIEEIAAGRYDADSLTDSERDNIAEYLKNNN